MMMVMMMIIMMSDFITTITLTINKTSQREIQQSNIETNIDIEFFIMKINYVKAFFSLKYHVIFMMQNLNFDTFAFILIILPLFTVYYKFSY